MRSPYLKYPCILFIILLVACNKDPKPTKNNNKHSLINCSDKYYLHSEPYVNPYTGPLFDDLPGPSIPPVVLHPDKFKFGRPDINPANPNEFCFHRSETLDNQVIMESLGLYKYNFCTNKTRLITAATGIYKADWSVKDWILFNNKSGHLCKIKSNGDSLITLFADWSDRTPKWNTTGTMYKYNFNEIFDENGQLIYTLPSNVGDIIDWYDEWHILHIAQGAQDVTKTDIRTNNSVGFAPMKSIGLNFLQYLHERGEFFGYAVKGDSINVLRYDVSSNAISYFGNARKYNSFVSDPFGLLNNNKVLVQQTLQDTLPQAWNTINTRSHLGITDLDGSNLRQIMLPE
jgi:hypothetical protein